MHNDGTARQTVEVATKLDRWARSTGVEGAQALVVDATDLYRAAHAYMSAIDRLIGQSAAPAEEHAKTLVEIQTWLYDELEDHLRSLKAPLESVINKLYEQRPEE